MPLYTEENEILIATDDLFKMSDGVLLYTRYAVPKGKGKCPVVYIRTPYEHSYNRHYDISKYAEDELAMSFITRGYAVLIQHCRGKGDSEGVCIPYENEEKDGLETLDYIRALPFYNGEIYITGASYLATVHLSYLSEKQSDIKGACLCIQTDRLYFRNYRNGLNYKLNNINWWSSMTDRQYPKRELCRAQERPYIECAKRVFGVDLPEFTDTLIHNACDEYWQKDRKWNVVDSLEMPVLFVEGWYDFYVEGMTDMWRRLPEMTKAKSSMIIGPYGHATSVGANSEYLLPNGNLPTDFVVEWFDSIRENRPYRYAEYGKINYYSIGADKWCAKEYPKGECRYLRVPLSDMTLCGKENGKAFVTYGYDPDNLCNKYKAFGIFRAHEPGSAESILSFIGDEIENEQSFFGCVKFHLSVCSDCEDTAFFARLYFIDGEDAYNLTEALGGLLHLVGEYKAGETVEIDLETPLVAFTLKKGMRIRIDISSETGNYLPHANVKGHFAYVTETKIAHNTIHIDESYVELPVE